MSRQSGYYWVKCIGDDAYQVAEFNGFCWYIDGVRLSNQHLESYFNVNETRILAPDEQQKAP